MVLKRATGSFQSHKVSKEMCYVVSLQTHYFILFNKSGQIITLPLTHCASFTVLAPSLTMYWFEILVSSPKQSHHNEHIKYSSIWDLQGVSAVLLTCSESTECSGLSWRWGRECSYRAACPLHSASRKGVTCNAQSDQHDSKQTEGNTILLLDQR